jgi:uncharacterized protein
MILSPKQLITQFNLIAHPEGGYYKETYRAAEIITQDALPARFSGNRSFSTAIYFLLEKGDFSAFHRIKSDECWHFYTGNTLNIYVLHLNGKLEIIHLGNDLAKGDRFQYVVPAGCWFASEPAEGSMFSFVGCTVAPGFNFADFEMAKAPNLALTYPQHATLIKKLCR